MIIHLGHCTVEWTDYGCITRFADGTEFGAHPHDTAHYHVIAHRCGYGDDIMAYCREHEFAHSFMWQALLNKPSDVLWRLAHGQACHPGDAAMEEMVAHTFQRWLRTNERPIIGGMAWDELKAGALDLLHPVQERMAA